MLVRCKTKSSNNNSAVQMRLNAIITRLILLYMIIAGYSIIILIINLRERERLAQSHTHIHRAFKLMGVFTSHIWNYTYSYDKIELTPMVIIKSFCLWVLFRVHVEYTQWNAYLWVRVLMDFMDFNYSPSSNWNTRFTPFILWLTRSLSVCLSSFLQLSLFSCCCCCCEMACRVTIVFGG